MFGINDDEIFRVNMPLYDLCDADDYWGITMMNHLINDLGKQPTIGDPALYVKKSNGKSIGVTGPYVDDVLNARNVDSERRTESTLKKFDTKPRVYDSFEF